MTLVTCKDVSKGICHQLIGLDLSCQHVCQCLCDMKCPAADGDKPLSVFTQARHRGLAFAFSGGTTDSR